MLFDEGDDLGAATLARPLLQLSVDGRALVEARAPSALPFEANLCDRPLGVRLIVRLAGQTRTHEQLALLTTRERPNRDPEALAISLDARGDRLENDTWPRPDLKDDFSRHRLV